MKSLFRCSGRLLVSQLSVMLNVEPKTSVNRFKLTYYISIMGFQIIIDSNSSSDSRKYYSVKVWYEKKMWICEINKTTEFTN